MRRRTFDVLVSAGGLVLAVVLVVAGGLLVWGHSFVDARRVAPVAEVFASDKASVG